MKINLINGVVKAVKVDFLAGTSIEESVLEAIDIVKSGVEQVYFEFNGVRIMVDKDSTKEAEVNFYYKSLHMQTLNIY